MQEYLPPPPDSGGNGNSEEANGDSPSKSIAEAAAKFEFTKVECLLFIFHTVGKQAPQFLTENSEILKEFKVNIVAINLLPCFNQLVSAEPIKKLIDSQSKTSISESVAIFCTRNSRIHKKTEGVFGK